MMRGHEQSGDVGDMTVRDTARQHDTFKALGSPSGLLLSSLFVLGLVLRLSGLLFNGMHDLDQILFEWGSGVRVLGIARAFVENYGVFSYALYGIAVAMAEQVPRFWWAPYKLMEVSFEALVLLALYLALPAGRKKFAFILYWLNPWFILHGAWQGFWEGPHTLCAWLAVLSLGKVRQEKLAWVLAGVTLMTGAMFKPQGLVYFVIPVGIYLGLQWIRYRRLAWVWFAVGVILVGVVATGFLVISGGGIWQIPRNYLTSATVMPNLCNGCISIWRPITVVLYAVLGPRGFADVLGPVAPLNSLLNLIFLCAAWALVAVFSWRIPLTQKRLAYPGVFLILTFAGLVMSQLGPRAHINHAYAGLVLLIPLAIANRRVLVPWVIMVAIHLYSHLAVYHLGRDMVLPEMYLDYAPARLLIARVNAALVTQAYTPLLQFQGSINQWLRRLPVEPVLTQLSVIQFVCVMMIIYEMFQLARPGLDTLLGRLSGDDETAVGDAVT